MLKVLLKKQLAELNMMYFVDNKTKKRRSTAGIIGFALLFLLVFVSVGSLFFVMAYMMTPFIKIGFSWLYFVMTAGIAVFVSSFLNMFVANSEIFGAKDNEFLLSLPIKPSKIIFSRMLSLYAEGLLFESVALLPAIGWYWHLLPKITAQSIAFPLLVWLISSLAVLGLSCIFGWLVAIITSRVKNRAIASAFFTVLFLAVYYFCYFRMQKIITNAISNAEKIAETVKKYLFPLYYMGKAAAGDGKALLLHLLICAVFAAAVYFVVAKSFFTVASALGENRADSGKKTEIKQSSVSKTLLRKETKRFFNSSAYLVNCGMGIIMMLAAAVFALIKRDLLSETVKNITAQLPWLSNLLPIAVLCILSMLLSMTYISAPSVSLEGETLWILRSLPVSGKTVLAAKERFHLTVTLVPSVITAAALSVSFGFGWLTTVLFVLFVISYELYIADFGLLINVMHPNFSWTNEAYPIKQGLSVGVTLFSGWGETAVMAAAAYFMRKFINTDLFIAVVTVIYFAVFLILRKRLMTAGAERFEQL